MKYRTITFGEFVKGLRIRQRMGLREFCLEHGHDPSNWSKIRPPSMPGAFLSSFAGPASHSMINQYENGQQFGTRENAVRRDLYGRRVRAESRRGRVRRGVSAPEKAS